jgi:hypothetical protein
MKGQSWQQLTVEQLHAPLTAISSGQEQRGPIIGGGKRGGAGELYSKGLVGNDVGIERSERYTEVASVLLLKSWEAE